jgi:hypothetical protein
MSGVSVRPWPWSGGLGRLFCAEAASSAARVTLQGAGIQLRDIRAEKDQLAARIQEVQAMLAMDTGVWRRVPTVACLLW